MAGWIAAFLLLAAGGIGYALHTRALAKADAAAAVLERRIAADSALAAAWKDSADARARRADSLARSDSVRMAHVKAHATAMVGAARAARDSALGDTTEAVQRAVKAVAAAYEVALAGKDSVIAAGETDRRALALRYDARLEAKDSVIAAQGRQIDALTREVGIYRKAAHGSFSLHVSGFLLGVLVGAAGGAAVAIAAG